MTIALYMDVHVHRAITTGLRLRDVDVLTAHVGFGPCVTIILDVPVDGRCRSALLAR